MAGSRKEYEMLFKLNAQLNGGYNSTFAKAQAQIATMQSKIQSLSKTQNDIAAYQKQQAAMEATRQKMATLQQQYDNIQKEISETEEYSSSLENKLLSKQRQIDKTAEALSRQTQSLNQMGAALEDAGVDTRNLSRETDRLEAEISDLRDEQEQTAESASQMGSSGAQAIQAYQQALVASGIKDALEEIFQALGACSDASVAFESSLTGVDKTTNLTKQELAEMSQSVKQMSRDIPVTTDEMLAIGETAGQLGIAKENLLDFSETMSMLSTATTMAADEGATMLAQFANITQMDPTYYRNLASAIVDLGNNYATTEQKITEMSQGIAASGSLAGMSEADMLGLSAAVSSLGIEVQAGGTSVSKLISELMTAVETGENLEEFAHVANMTAEDFKKAWGENAAGALESFVVGLSDTDRLGQSAIVTLSDLGIVETRMQRTILSLSNSGDLLSRAIKTANTAWEENTALTAEAEKRYATTESQQVMLQNSFNNLKIAIGDNYTPALRELYQVGNDVIGDVTEFVEQNPALVKGITATVGVLGLVTAALAAYAVGAKLAAAASALFTAAIPGVNIIMAATAGIAALTGVIVGMANAEETEEEKVRSLTETSREQYQQLQDTKAEYEEVCKVYGETSEEALYLKWRVDEMGEAFENNKQTLSEYVAENDAARESMRGLLDSNMETYEQAEINEGTTLALVHRLQELASQTDQTVETQEEMKAIISELNNTVPELALTYEDVVSGTKDYATAIESMVKAEAAAQKYEQSKQGMVDALNAKYEYEQKLADSIKQKESAQTRYNAAEKEYLDYQKWYLENKDSSYLAMDEKYIELDAELGAASEALQTYTEEQAENQQVLDKATSDYQYYLDEMVAYTEYTNEATGATSELTGSIQSTFGEVEALTEAYGLCYNAAYESVTGQYEIWEEAAEVVATSSETINGAIDSQVTYWQNYNSNLQSLTERSADIEGLREMISSFADGSSESVNAIAGMANASDEELAAMVEDWKALQTEQENVATSIAELNTNFTQQMDELGEALAKDIQDMDLNEEAAASGRNTVQGFIDAAYDQLPSVSTAYEAVAKAAMDAIDKKLDIHSPSREMAWRAQMTWEGFINQTKAMEPELQSAMAEAASMGTDAADMQITAVSPQLIAAMAAHRGYDAIQAERGSDGITIAPSITFQIEGNATPETVDALNLQGEEFARRVIEVLEDAGVDTQRRRY